MHKSLSGPCILGNGNLRIVIRHCHFRVPNAGKELRTALEDWTLGYKGFCVILPAIRSNRQSNSSFL